jgi:hypothetical protein
MCRALRVGAGAALRLAMAPTHRHLIGIFYMHGQ